MQFTNIIAIIAATAAVGNAAALPDVQARSLGEQVGQLKQLHARALGLEAEANLLKTREAHDAAIEARFAHEEAAIKVKRDLKSSALDKRCFGGECGYYPGGEYPQSYGGGNFGGNEFQNAGDSHDSSLLDLGLGALNLDVLGKHDRNYVNGGRSFQGGGGYGGLY